MTDRAEETVIQAAGTGATQNPARRRPWATPQLIVASAYGTNTFSATPSCNTPDGGNGAES